jgi:hypothetical protein
MCRASHRRLALLRLLPPLIAYLQYLLVDLTLLLLAHLVVLLQANEGALDVLVDGTALLLLVVVLVLWPSVSAER